MSTRKLKTVLRHTPSRLDGARHWRRTLDQFVALHLMAGVAPAEFEVAITASLNRHRSVKRQLVPPVEVLEHSRLLTHWRSDPAYLDARGVPRHLRMSGPSSFSSLTRACLGDAKPRIVLKNLKRHHLVSVDRQGRIILQSNAFLLQGMEKGHALGYSLSTLEGIIGTTYSNICCPDVEASVGRFHRSVFAERFDPQDLAAYDRFLREEGIQFLMRQDQWLKGRESRKGRKTRRTVYVGCGLFGLRSL